MIFLKIDLVQVAEGGAGNSSLFGHNLGCN